MPITSRPDLLPFAKPARIGLDKHGLVSSGKLNGADYPVTVHCGEVRAVSGQTTTTGGSGFQPYALLSGSPPNIGGQVLESSSYTREEWIYSDTKHSWVIRADLTHDYALHQLTLTVTLQKSFGVFGRAVAVTPRTLASITWQPTSYAGTPVVLKSGSRFYYHGFLLTHSMTGGIAVLNIARKNSTTASWSGTYAFSLCDTSVVSLAFHDSLKVTITGDGDLDNSGTGIVASVENILASTEMLVVNTSTGSSETSPSLATTDVSDLYSDTYTGICSPYPDTTCVHTQEQARHMEFVEGGTEVSDVYDDSESIQTYIIGKAATTAGAIVDLKITRHAASTKSVTAACGGSWSFKTVAKYMTYPNFSESLCVPDAPEYPNFYPTEMTTAGEAAATGSRSEVRETTTTLEFSSGQVEDYKIATAQGTGSSTSQFYVNSPTTCPPGEFPFTGVTYVDVNWPSVTTALVSNIEGGVDYAPLAWSLPDEVVFHSANVFGLWKRRPIAAAETFVLLSVDGQTKDLGAGLSAGQTVTYHPVTHSWAIDTAAVWV